MIVGLFLESIEHVSTRVQIQNQVDLCVTFVDFLQTDDIGMVALGHDKNFFSKTLDDFIGLDCQYIEAFCDELDTCFSVHTFPDGPRNTRSENGSVVDATVDIFDAFPLRCL